MTCTVLSISNHIIKLVYLITQQAQLQVRDHSLLFACAIHGLHNVLHSTERLEERIQHLTTPTHFVPKKINID